MRFYAFCLGLLIAIGAQAEVFEQTLSNGLKVIVKEDRRAPVVVQQIWYRAGSMDEMTGVTGVAHVLEHMMFKGTKEVPVGEFSRRIAAAGGRENAFTSYDYTAYFQQLHKSQLELAMKLEADRMHNLRLSDEEFAKEIRVVMEERRWRTDDDARALLDERLMATAYQEHPYRNPIVGWMNDLKNMTADDARLWYQTWYAPNNATLVIAGDVDAKQVFALARKYYGRIHVGKLPLRKPYEEPAQLGIKRIVVKAPAELPHLVMAWHAPTLRDVDKDWQPYALSVLAGVLDGNDSARLNKSLVRERQVATSIGAGYANTSRGPTMFSLEATPAAGTSVEALEVAIREQLQMIVRDGVSEEELRRVRAQVTAAEVYKLDSLFYQAMQIGQIESIGLSQHDLPVILKKLQAVTAAQVQAVARDILRDDQLTVAVLDPQPLAAEKPQQGGHAHAH
ncbi:MAG: insulinase family protein [Gammaproteobacteria bacterium]|nr:insulinase family protein [Sideroxydans sp.]MBU3904089.1 insulinase family protein [Gammaproteobacteria bacterium]MBU4046055.1 insulinase family protein [Gammaproteobacteria bacterium]MBU4150828.1 insulinase family protein [Gammaproteobacteria bacterium]